MTIHRHAHNKIFLTVHAALATLAFSLPGMAKDLTITDQDSSAVSSNEYSVQVDDKFYDPLVTDPAPQEGAAIVPIDGSAPVASGNNVTIDSFAGAKNETISGASGSKDYSVVGGGRLSGEGDVTGNTVTITGSSTLGGMVVGGVNGGTGTGKVGGSAADANKVILKGGTVARDVIGGLGVGSGDISHNEVTVEGGTAKKNVVGGWAVIKDQNASGADVEDNKVTISGGTVEGNVAGGLSQSGAATKNEVKITGGAITGYIVGGEIQQENSTAAVSGNRVTIESTDSAPTIGDNIVGGISRGGSVVSGNIVGITNESSNALSLKGVMGGSSSTGGSAQGNTVTLYNRGSGSITVTDRDVTGGRVSGSTADSVVSGNRIEIGGGVTLNKNAVGGILAEGTHGSVTGNTVVLKSGATLNGSGAGYVIGGYIYSQSSNYGSADENTVLLDATDGDVSVNSAIGGWSDGNAGKNTVRLDATGTHKITISADLIGGRGAKTGGEASGNHVIVNGIATLKNVYGGEASAGALSNTVLLNLADSTDSKVSGNIIGGNSTSGNASHNTIDLQGYTAFADSGEISILGGSTGSGDATHNTINIGEHVKLGANVALAGGKTSSGDASTGNTLNLNSWSGTVKSVNGFATYNIRVADGQGSDPIVTLADTSANSSNIEGSAINLFTSSGAPLAVGTEVTVFSATSGALTAGNGLANGGAGRSRHGVTILYDTETTVADGVMSTRITGERAHPQAKAFSEGFLGGVAFVNGGADVAAGQGLTNLLSSARRHAASGQSGLAGFGALSWGDSRHKTGSHVDVKGYNFLVGLGASSGNFTFGGFFETGKGDYDSSNRFAGFAGVKGNGDTRYDGGGVLGRFDAENGLYAEGSLRAGRLKNDFSSDLADDLGVRAGYDSRSRYVGAHLGLGYTWKATGPTRADVYGKYFWTRQSGDKVRLDTSAGDRIEFDAVNSQRVRLGGRVTWDLSEQTEFFAGAAWEHEFDGVARAKAYGRSIKAPSMKGDSALGEIGFTARPSATSPLSLEVTVQAYDGDRQGASGGLNLKYMF
jgi:hypothetical protein